MKETFEDLDNEEVRLLLVALLVLWEEHCIGNKAETDKLALIAKKLRNRYHMEKSEFEEF